MGFNRIRREEMNIKNKKLWISLTLIFTMIFGNLGVLFAVEPAKVDENLKII